MRNIRKLSILLALCLVLVLVPVNRTSAADYVDGLWLRFVPGKQGVVALCAEEAVASGVITITYNPEWMTFQSVTVDDAYVLAHAVNDKEAGKVVISWIAPKDNVAQGAHVLMLVEFTGISEDEYVTLTGTVQNASGEAMAITKIDVQAALAAETDAEDLKAEDYTADSFAAVQSALQNVSDLLAQVTVTPAQLDAATQALVTAMENLVVYTPEPPPTEPPTEPTEPTEPPTEPTEPGPTEPTQPGSSAAKPDPTQPSTQAQAAAPQQDDSWMLIALAAVLVVSVVAAIVILKKRGKK